MNTEEKYVIGVDFGTSSVRALLINADNGEEKSVSEFFYPRWNQGLFCDPSRNQFRQHPLDYIEGIEFVIKDLIEKAGENVRENVKAISIDTTGSTPVAVDEKGVPLALNPEFKENPNAMFFLWKDHTAVQEAEEINNYASEFETNYLKYVGGIYSSEWFWAKLLYALRKDAAVKKACFSWVEHCDWMPFLLTGGKNALAIKRGTCAAGHKGLWAEEFVGFPPEEFFSGLDTSLKNIRKNLPDKTYSADKVAGTLSAEWANKFGLSTNVLIGVGALDAHMGAVGGQIEPYFLSKVMGTSTCDMMVAPGEEMKETLVRGICGQVQSSVVPGMQGMEAGQSAFGDIYAWFRELLFWPVKNMLSESELINKETAEKLQQEIKNNILKKLNSEASKIPLSKDLELAVDWLNGRRTPDANQLLKGAITNLSLGSDAPKIYRSFVEATCFGSRKIVERFKEEGIPVKGIIGVGGVAKKSPFIMQMMADVLGMPIKVHKSEQTCASGAAMFAATIAGIYPNVEVAMHKLGQGFEEEYQPDLDKHEIYILRYEEYKSVCGFLEK
ncbi:ribulokinase [Salegentibacter sp. T436]|nr:ribulokinase [Salegentibacter sp. T436]